MQVFTYSEARQNLSEILNISLLEEVIIKRKDGNDFSITPKVKSKKSPFDIRGVETKATTENILDAISESRSNYPLSS